MTLLQTRGTCNRRVAVYGTLVLDIEAEQASMAADLIILQQSDWAILSRLSAAAGAFVHSADLLADIWGEDMRDDTAFLRGWVHRLNDRLGALHAGRPLIDSIPGGYRLLSPTEWNAGTIAMATN